MPVLINMEMPKCCESCPCISGYGRMCMAAHNRSFTQRERNKNLDAIMHNKEYRPSWCPMEEVEK